ncbi:MAG: hypothetical protein ACI9G9_001340 [Psychromonas sp.]|jgi:hypothetical protein
MKIYKYNILKKGFPVYLLILVLISIIANNTPLAQTPFEGKLIYRVSVVDTSFTDMIPDRKMTIYTNDTMVRIEIMNDQLGLQTTIRHMALNKSYMLLDLGERKFAIKTDLTNDTTEVRPYVIKHKCKRKKILGEKTKKAIVFRDDLKAEKEVYYSTKIRPEILNIYDGIKGLPLEYYLSSADGLMRYELISIERMSIHRDNFGIPSDYKRVTFNEFVDQMKQSDN